MEEQVQLQEELPWCLVDLCAVLAISACIYMCAYVCVRVCERDGISRAPFCSSSPSPTHSPLTRLYFYTHTHTDAYP